MMSGFDDSQGLTTSVDRKGLADGQSDACDPERSLQLLRAMALRLTKRAGWAVNIYSAEGVYRRMGTIRIGEGPFYFSPETVLPHLLYGIPRVTRAAG